MSAVSSICPYPVVRRVSMPGFPAALASFDSWS